MLRTSLFAAVAAMALTSGAAMAQNIVTNGDFETGDFSGWTLTGQRDNEGVERASNGTFEASFGQVGGVGGISQSLTTVAGHNYHISFDLSNDGSDEEDGSGATFFSALFGGSTLVSMTDAASFGLTTFSYDAIADADSTLLSFNFRQDPAYFYLDNVSVTDTSPSTSNVPEPASWAMMVGGFGLLGGALRRRRVAVAFA